MPESRADVHFDGGWTKTPSGEDFLMAKDGQGEDRLIMFATEVNIKLLCEAQTIYVDGTFQTCPSLFYQIFTIRAFKNGRQFPLRCLRLFFQSVCAQAGSWSTPSPKSL